MKRLASSAPIAALSILICCAASSAGAADRPLPRAQVLQALRAAHPQARVSQFEDRVARIWGGPLGGGATAQAAAERFVRDYAGAFDVPARDLIQANRFNPGRPLQPVMIDPATGGPKFMLVHYSHERGGVPVFGSELRVLVANRPGNPVVLASSSLRELGAFDAAAARRAADPIAAQAAVLIDEPELMNYDSPQLVIWAGDADTPATPRLAIQFLADNGLKGIGDYQRWLIVADAITGEPIYRENQIRHVDVNGSVSGLATQGLGADICGAEAATALPYAEARIDGGNTAFADAAGAFTISNGGASEVTVRTSCSGQYFDVIDLAGALEEVSTNVTPSGPANLTLNSANVSEFVRAQVNSYLQANLVRDYALTYNPAYPVIDTQIDFDVFVNIASTCNAFYDGISINFFRAGGGCSNTANSSVVHHEYGHHLIQVAGSGQGQYGEGMSDCVAILLSDDPILGYGFQNNCAAGIRTGANAFQYPCVGAIHTCGQLISGCVWSLRNGLLATIPGTYRQVLSDLTINSILLHTGTRITPQIGIDFLVLDDDDADLANGTPHFTQIFNAFNAHSMIDFIGFEYPLGQPTIITPNAAATLRVDVTPGFGTSANNGASLNYRIGNVGPFTTVGLTQLAAGEFEGLLPATDCPDSIQWYITANYNSTVAPSGVEVDPSLAPGRVYQTVAADSVGDFLSYNFEVNPGWTVSGTAVDGQWDVAPGVPINCGRADPPSDYDGSGRCFLTDNSSASQCNSDVDTGTTILTSQVIDISGLTNPYVQYARYYSNTDGGAPQADTFVVEVSANGGGTWVNLETVGPALTSPNPEVYGDEWILRSFRIADFVAVNNQFRIRFTAQDQGSGSLIEAGVDAFKIYSFACPTIPLCASCPGDVNGDGRVDGDDIQDFAAAHIAGSLVTGCEDMDADTDVDGTDLTLLVNKLRTDASTPCP